MPKKEKSPEQIQQELEENLREEQEQLRKIDFYSNVTPEYIQDVISHCLCQYNKKKSAQGWILNILLIIMIRIML